jgi:hypothetical protein
MHSYGVALALGLVGSGVSLLQANESLPQPFDGTQSEAAEAPVSLPQSSRVRRFLQGLGLTYERFEFEEVEFRHNFSQSVFFFPVTREVEVDVSEVEREMLRLRYQGGIAQVGYHIDLFYEELQIDGPRITTGPDFTLSDDVELFGLGVGALGRFDFFQQAAVSTVLEYDLGVSFHQGKGEGIIEELNYFEAQLQAGIGLSIHGVTLSAGAMGSYWAGNLNLDASVTGEELEADNLGGYASVSWNPSSLPLAGRLQAHFGNVSGIQATIQFRF